MSEEPYVAFEKDHEQMILRDYLAVDRTMMANETSFMSYVRTSLTMIAAGATLIKFFSEPTMQALGWGFIVIGGWLAIHGYQRFRQVDIILHRVKGETVHRAKKLTRSKKVFGSALNLILGRSK